MLNCVQGNVVRFLPPLTLEIEHVDVALEVLHGLLAEHAPAATEARLATVSA